MKTGTRPAHFENAVLMTVATFAILANGSQVAAQTTAPVKGKVLPAVTRPDPKGETGGPTGLHSSGVTPTRQNPQSAQAAGEAVPDPGQPPDVIGRLTRYAVKPAHRQSFRVALSNYVSQALAEAGNIQAEAYTERDDESRMWLVERWQSRDELGRFGGSPQSRAVDSLSREALAAGAETFHVTDLEPISKPLWRRAARAGDHPLTVMLFVDSQAGTQAEFKAAYHVAMPQFRSEPGVVTYQLSQVVGEGTRFVTYEKFRSEEAFQFHLNFPPIRPVLDYLQTRIRKQPFQAGLHTLVEFAPLTRE